MSTNDSEHQNRFGRIEQSNETVSREELRAQLEIKELALTRLRRRVTELEEAIGVEANDFEDISECEEDCRDHIGTLRGDDDE